MFNDFMSLLFPECCLACQKPLVKHEELLCTHCRAALPITDYHLIDDNELIKRFDGKVPLQKVITYLSFVKKGKAQAIVHSLKYKGREDAGVLMGRWYGEELREHRCQTYFDLIVPVPLHQKKLRKRGYNQAAAFAEGLAEALKVRHIPNYLERTVFTETQTRKKLFDRWLNVENIFAVNAEFKGAFSGKHILLVDDVLTTGATMEACVNALLQESKTISLAAIAAA